MKTINDILFIITIVLSSCSFAGDGTEFVWLELNNIGSSDDTVVDSSSFIKFIKNNCLKVCSYIKNDYLCV